jgi:hypothetical protein
MSRKEKATPWRMVRVTLKTHQVLTALQARREHGRMLGRVSCSHERLTQDDVVAYLIGCEASLQERASALGSVARLEVRLPSKALNLEG